MTRTLVFIDSRVADYQSLIAGLGADAEWVLIDAYSDGVDQMRSALAGYSGLDSIQIVSHGSAGSVLLGTTVLDASSLGGYETQLKAIGASLSATGDLLLYGCNVAQGDAGLQFINQLAQLTGADLAASVNTTGAGGDWVLESTTAAVSAVNPWAVGLSDFGYALEGYRLGARDPTACGRLVTCRPKRRYAQRQQHLIPPANPSATAFN